MKNKKVKQTNKVFNFSYLLTPIRYLLILLLFSFSQITYAMGNSSDQEDIQRNQAMERAKQDYRVFLEQLKVLNGQFQEVQSHMKEVIKDEGVPVWDDKTGGLVITHDLNLSNAPVEETETEMIVRFEIAGLQKDSIKVAIVEKKELQVIAKRKIKDDRGDINQRVSLPSLAKEKGSKASYEDGILTVTIPKESPSKNQVVIPVN